MQRVDDVTGQPLTDGVRMSAAEREQERQQIVLTIESLKLRWHPDAGELFSGADEAIERRIGALHRLIDDRTRDIGGHLGDLMSHREAHGARLDALERMTFWQRLRWLATGR
jgi:hypothetical protein